MFRSRPHTTITADMPSKDTNGSCVRLVLHLILDVYTHQRPTHQVTPLSGGERIGSGILHYGVTSTPPNGIMDSYISKIQLVAMN